MRRARGSLAWLLHTRRELRGGFRSQRGEFLSRIRAGRGVAVRSDRGGLTRRPPAGQDTTRFRRARCTPATSVAVPLFHQMGWITSAPLATARSKAKVGIVEVEWSIAGVPAALAHHQTKLSPIRHSACMMPATLAQGHPQAGPRRMTFSQNHRGLLPHPGRGGRGRDRGIRQVLRFHVERLRPAPRVWKPESWSRPQTGQSRLSPGRAAQHHPELPPSRSRAVGCLSDRRVGRYMNPRYRSGASSGHACPCPRAGVPWTSFSTSTCLIPAGARWPEATQTGISPATGQRGAVRVPSFTCTTFSSSILDRVDDGPGR